ncbi:DUF3993 domain-containing protein [Rummeliibacillus stabekisii]|uniref:DUF3993 domain-containing protein n=1 Tax=Rummeliibacillus stabekisii TaxID=241244 RepID=UPI001171FD2C|nr:DUF3993 domain-containing protein [Rummeliibacillus stabekisii]MBB5170409.1 hypothetical protein [Rummeliibacillus stabekisii]GEL04667.1 hypothetical protein RST01_12940 [Rummeliibacillus stabekisii]
MKKGMFAILSAVLVFVLSFNSAEAAPKITIAKANHIYKQASNAQWSINKPVTKTTIYKRLNPYFEKRYIDGYFKANYTVKTKKNGKTYYEIPPTDFVPGLLWKRTFSWTSKTKIRQYEKNSMDYLTIYEEQPEYGLDDPHTIYYKFRKKIKSKTYKVYDYAKNYW